VTEVTGAGKEDMGKFSEFEPGCSGCMKDGEDGDGNAWA
jgi:hypothetical protein